MHDPNPSWEPRPEELLYPVDEIETKQAEQSHGCPCWFQGELLAIAHGTHTISSSRPSRNVVQSGGPPENRPFWDSD